MLDEYGDELLADFATEYGLLLPDVVHQYRPRIVLALARQLPLGSRYVSKSRGNSGEWGLDRQAHLTADVYDVLMKILETTIRANSKNPQRVKELPEHPRASKPKKKVSGLLARVRGQKGSDDGQPKSRPAPGTVVPLRR